MHKLRVNVLLLLDEQRQLIEKFVKSNAKFYGNEDLFEDFCNEALQKSYMIFNSGSGVRKIESYVSKVVNTSIVNVLKDSGRVRKVSSGYVATNEVSIHEFNDNIGYETAENQVTAIPVDFEDPRNSVEEIIIKKDLLQRIADVVCTIHNEQPQKNYLDIFHLRYIKAYKQSEISKQLNLSQSEVSKRLLELSKLIKSYLNS